MKISDKKIRRKISVLAVFGILALLLFVQPVGAVTVNANDITMADGDWIGLSGGSAGKIYFDSTASPDQIEILNADVGINDADPDFRMEIAGSSGSGYFGVSSLASNNGDIFIIDSNGNVGIGTTSPSAKLDVEVGETNGAATIGSSTNSATGGYAIALGSSTTASGESSIAMGSSTTASQAYSTAMGLSTTASGYRSTAMGSYITASGDNSFGIGLDLTSRTVSQDNTMAIMGGKVGIGILSPNSELHIGGTTPQITIGDADAEDSSILFDGNAQDFYLALDDSTDDLTIGTGSTIGSSVKMVIENGGNVGIGIVNPDTELHVNGDIKQKITTSDVSNPPTDAELDTLWTSPATQGDGWTAYLKDSNTDSLYQIVVVGSTWYVFTANKAT